MDKKEEESLDNDILSNLDGRLTYIERNVNLLKLSLANDLSKIVRRLEEIESRLTTLETKDDDDDDEYDD
jgi:hypothetical protein